MKATIVRIPGPDGEARPYAVTPVDPAGDALAFVVTGEGDQTYRVSRDRRGRWRCACDGFLWRGRCKHAKKLRETYDLPTEGQMAKSSTTTKAPANDPAAAAPAAETRHDTTPPAPQRATPAVYGAIAKVQAAMSEVGIAKSRKGQGFQFRGIDDVMQALSPVLVEFGLLILPRVTARESVERQSKAGSPLYFATVAVEYDFVAVADGSTHVVATVGEAMDVSDKATNKALSAAYKYACFQAFCIPLEGTPDADAETHEPAAAGHAQNGTAAGPNQGAVREESPPPADPDKLKLADADARLAAEGLSRPREMLEYIAAEMRAQGWTWPANKADAQKAAAAFERQRVNDRLERLVDGLGWAWEELVAQLGLPEGTLSPQMTLASLREGVKVLEAAKAEAELTQRLRT